MPDGAHEPSNTELAEAIASLRRLMVQQFSSSSNGLRAEMRQQFGAVRGEIRELDGKVALIDGKVALIDGKVALLEAKVDQFRSDVEAAFHQIHDAIADHRRLGHPDL